MWSGSYMDGKSTAVRRVTVELDAGRGRLVRAEVSGAELANWPKGTIACDTGVEGLVVVHPKGQTEEHVTIRDPDFARQARALGVLAGGIFSFAGVSLGRQLAIFGAAVTVLVVLVFQ